MPVPASSASQVNIPLYVKDELLVPSEDDYSVRSALAQPCTALARTMHIRLHVHFPLLASPLLSSLPHHPPPYTNAPSTTACVAYLPCQPLLDGRITEAEWLEDCELLQAAYDRNTILKRLRIQLTTHTTRQHTTLYRLYTALSLLVCCFCILLDDKAEQLRLTTDVARQRHAVLTAYVETMNRKYQYRQLRIAFECDGNEREDGGSMKGASACGVSYWFAVRLEQTSPSDRDGIGEEATVAARHARSRSHQRQKSASLMGQTKRLLSASSKVQVHPYLPPAIVLPADNDDIEAREAMEQLS